MQLLEIPYDPTTLANEHDERIDVLESQIAEKARLKQDEAIRRMVEKNEANSTL